jgi:tRNA (cytosine38-C5)-methyltransferase
LNFFGQHYGAMQALNLIGDGSLTCEIVAHFDINPNANLTYKHNFPEVNTVDTNLEHLDSEYFDQLKPDAFLMSPPCQPYTRAGKQLDTQDPRAKALLHLIQVIQNMKNPPEYILLENVKNFEISDSCKLLMEALENAEYAYQEFILSPVQFGIPNERVRYFLIARRHAKFNFTLEKKYILAHIPNHPLFEAPLPVYIRGAESEVGDEKKDDFLVVSSEKPPPASKLALERSKTLSEYLEAEERKEYLVPEAVLKKSSGYCFDIVNKDSKRCSCFTKSYGKYVRGTGSAIQTEMIGVSLDTFEF